MPRAVPHRGTREQLTDANLTLNVNYFKVHAKSFFFSCSLTEVASRMMKTQDPGPGDSTVDLGA